MSEVMFSFLGVCTYFDAFRSFFPDGPAHRMLLVNGQNSGISGVEPHIAKIQMFDAQMDSVEPPSWFPPRLPGFPNTYTFSLEGTGFTITVERENGSFINDALALPSLQDQLSVPLPPPNPAVVYDANPETASVYVDFEHGTITGKVLPIDDPAAITQLVIGAPGDTVTVKFKQWGEPDNVWSVTLHNDTLDEQGNLIPAGVNITNFPEGGNEDNPSDFFLQYLTVLPFPSTSDITIPDRLDLLELPVSQYNYSITGLAALDVHPGCSNSNYP
jgi:hypothetical protein